MSGLRVSYAFRLVGLHGTGGRSFLYGLVIFTQIAHLGRKIKLDTSNNLLYYMCSPFILFHDSYKTMPKHKKQRDICIVKHAAYLRALKAGFLRCGHVAVGGTMGNHKSKAEKSKLLYRKKVDE